MPFTEPFDVLLFGRWLEFGRLRGDAPFGMASRAPSSSVVDKAAIGEMALPFARTDEVVGAGFVTEELLVGEIDDGEATDTLVLRGACSIGPQASMMACSSVL